MPRLFENPTEELQLSITQSVFDRLLRNQILQYMLHERRVEPSKTPINGILPVPLEKLRPRVGVHRPSNEEVAESPAEGRD